MSDFNPPCVCGHERRHHVYDADREWCVNCPFPRTAEDSHAYQPDYLTVMQAAFNRKD